MGKTLIGPKNVDRHICRDTNALYLDNSMILTCSAKDYLRNKGVSIVYGKRPVNDPSLSNEPEIKESGIKESGIKEIEGKQPEIQETEALAPGAGTRHLEDLLGTIIKVLKEDHGITDPTSIEKLSLAILSKLG